jgi:hypothetical protein
MLTQLNPTIPLRSERATGEAIAVIDYSIEHDLMWVIVDEKTGEIWTVPNRDVRGRENYSAGRLLKSRAELSAAIDAAIGGKRT